MEVTLKKLDLRSCRDRNVVTGNGPNNYICHAVIGVHIRNYFVIVPHDGVHASRPDGQTFALTQFRSPAYNFNIPVADSAGIGISAPVKRAIAG